jgi:plastocyanin
MLFNVVALTQADFDAWLAKLVEVENATPPPAPSGATALELAAKNVAYDKHDFTVPGNAPFVINFKNDDVATLTHDVDIHGLDGTSVIADQDPIAGGTSKSYQYEGLAPGTYQFFCSVHPGVPAMQGTLTVQ